MKQCKEKLFRWIYSQNSYQRVNDICLKELIHYELCQLDQEVDYVLCWHCLEGSVLLNGNFDVLNHYNSKPHTLLIMYNIDTELDQFRYIRTFFFFVCVKFHKNILTGWKVIELFPIKSVLEKTVWHWFVMTRATKNMPNHIFPI